MLFQRFLKKKQPPPATVEDQGALAERARDHADPAVRREATRRLHELAVLRALLDHDEDAGVREIASARYRHLLCAPPTPEISVEERVSEIAALRDQRILEQVALQAEAPDVRRAAIVHLTSQDTLALCAVQDAQALNRAAAVERVEDKDALERIQRQIGKKDKTVLRVTRTKLHQISERAQRPLQVQRLCEELCQKAERLGRLEQWGQDRAILEHLDREWAQVRSEADETWRERYEGARQRFLAAYDAHTKESAARIAAGEAEVAVHAEREALLARLGEASSLGSEEAIRALCGDIDAAWNGLDTLPAARQRALDQRYRALSAAAMKAIETLREHRAHLAQVAKASAKAERLLGEPKPLDSRAVSQLIEQTRERLRILAQAGVETSGAAGTADALEAAASVGAADGAGTREDSDTRGEVQAAEALLQRLEDRIRVQRRHAEQRLKQLSEKLADLEQHLEAGELRKADPLFQSLRAGLDLVTASGMHNASTKAIGARLQGLAPRLRELQQWRRWGADQHREALCLDMERLVSADLPLEALAERLSAMRKDWRDLEQGGPRANEQLRERFQHAAEALHARCRPYLETRKIEHEAHRAARESVCDQIEDFLAKVDWERVDWKRVLRAEREIRQTWASIGHVEARHYRPLERRFRLALKQLDKRLDNERRANQALKHALIRRIEELVDEPDLEQAIEQAKALQREWHTTVPARQKDENRLWQTFRAACDAVFERRAALHQAHASELKEHLEARQAICDELLALATGEPDPERVKHARLALERRWEESRLLPVPRHSGAHLNERWHQAQETLNQALRDADDRQRRASLRLLQRQAELCEALERPVLDADVQVEGVQPTGTGEPRAPGAALPEASGAPGQEDVRAAWTELPAHADAGMQNAMAERFALALACGQDPDARQALRLRYQENAVKLNQICLQLEILSGVETPKEHAQERLAFQVARLTERMVDGEEDPLQSSTRLLKEWYLLGPTPGGAQGLDERFARIRAALVQEPLPGPDET